MGALCGILLTFSSSHITYLTNNKVIVPTVRTLCPTYGCNNDYFKKEDFHLFLIEFIGSFVLVLTYLIVRYTDMPCRPWMKYLGPFIIMTVTGYTAVFNATTSAGPQNPTIAIELLFWSMGAYNDIDDPVNNPGLTEFSYNKFGRYAWLYIVAPIFGGILAGFMAKMHIKSEIFYEEHKDEKR